MHYDNKESIRRSRSYHTVYWVPNQIPYSRENKPCLPYSRDNKRPFENKHGSKINMKKREPKLWHF